MFNPHILPRDVFIQPQISLAYKSEKALEGDTVSQEVSLENNNNKKVRTLFAFYSYLKASHKEKLEYIWSFQSKFIVLFLLGSERDKVLTCNRGIQEKRRPLDLEYI